MTPFFKAGGRITAGSVHFVEQHVPSVSSSPAAAGASDDGDTILVPAGETEFAKDAAFGYRSSNLVDWIHEKTAAAAAAKGGKVAPATARVSSVSLHQLREGGPVEVGKHLAEARGGCVVVNAVEERDLEVWASPILFGCSRPLLLRVTLALISIQVLPSLL